MGKINELIQQYCPDGVEYVNVGDVCDIHKGVQFNKSDMKEMGSYPVMNGGINPSGYAEVFNEDENTITISQGGASAGYVNFLDSKFWLGAHCYALKPYSVVMNRYLYHYIKQSEITLQQCQYGAGIPALAKSTISSLEIPLPPLPVQEAIVNILDRFTVYAAELQAELQARQQQYNYYRDTLLSFEGREDVQWKKLGEVADLGTGSHNTQDGLSEGKYPFYTRGSEILYLNNYDYDETAIITAGDGAGVGKVFHFVQGKYALHQRAYRIVPNKKIVLARFVYYYIGATFYNYIMKSSVSSSVVSIRKPMMVDYPIPVPSIEEQEKVISILDRFDTLVNDLSQGLPAEIEARQQQYEYYRDRLLTFNRK